MQKVITYFMRKIKQDNVGAYAAQATLFLIMSFIPFMLVLLSLLKFTPVTEDMVLSVFELVSPGFVSSSVIHIVDEVYTNTHGVVIISIIFAVYSAAKAIQSLRYGLNIVYEIEETRNWFVLRLRAMVETFLLILGILSLMVLLVFGKRIQDILVQYAPIVSVITSYILKFRLVILFFVLIIIFGFIYQVLPNRKATFRSQLVGAIGCSAAWYIFSFGLSIYINFFHGFSFYGSLTMLILLMFWLSIAMYIFLVCAQFNYAMEMVIRELKIDFSNRKKERAKKKLEEFRMQREENKVRQKQHQENEKRRRRENSTEHGV